MTQPLDGGFVTRVLGAWEKAAASMAEASTRDPRTLEVGANLLRANLLWMRAIQASVEVWTPLLRREDS